MQKMKLMLLKGRLSNKRYQQNLGKNREKKIKYYRILVPVKQVSAGNSQIAVSVVVQLTLKFTMGWVTLWYRP